MVRSRRSEKTCPKSFMMRIFFLLAAAAAAAAAATLPDQLQVLKVPVNLDWLLFKYPNFKAH